MHKKRSEGRKEAGAGRLCVTRENLKDKSLAKPHEEDNMVLNGDSSSAMSIHQPKPARSICQPKPVKRKQRGLGRLLEKKLNMEDKSEPQMDFEASHVADVAAESQGPTDLSPPVAADSARAMHKKRSEGRKEAGVRRFSVRRVTLKQKFLAKSRTKAKKVWDGESSSARSFHQPKPASSIRQPKPVKAKQRGLRRLLKKKLNIKDESEPEWRCVYMNTPPNWNPEGSLAYHQNFLETVFGSRASEMTVEDSMGEIFNAFVTLLTDEDIEILEARDEVAYVGRGGMVTFE